MHQGAPLAAPVEKNTAMIEIKGHLRYLAVVLATAIAMSIVSPSLALAQSATTGTVSGTVTNAATGAPIANASVTASSPSGRQTTKSDANGFYILQNLLPDTYTVSVQAGGFESQSLPGVTVVQSLTVTENIRMSAALRTIASVTSRAAGSLVKPDTTSDTYSVTGQQLSAISLGNDTHKTLYQYIATIPGITGSGFPAQPRVHGGSAADISYQFDGIPINDQMSGLFTTNLSNVGIGSILVSTGGLPASQAASGIGIINTVVKSGTYPPFGDFTYGSTPQYRNMYYTAEYGGASPNHKLSWFLSADMTNALNQYTPGQTYPLVLIEQQNGPGVVKTADLIGNFHWRPNDRNDIQFLIQNGLGDFDWGYLMQRAPGEPVPLTVNMCPGAVAVGDGSGSPTYTGGQGGVAPNGQPCPEGLYFGTAATGTAGGNYWHHYSGIGKLQWNHVINDHSSLQFRLSENYNQYIFDQPVADANLAQFQNNRNVDVNNGCPQYPYAPGTPVLYPGFPGTTPTIPGTYTPNPKIACMQLANWVSTGYWEDRSSNLYSGSIVYDNALNANSSIELGVGDDYSNQHYTNYYKGWFNPVGTWGSIWPALLYDSSYPLHTPNAYAQGDFQVGKWKLSPGIRWTSRHYGYPIGGGATSTAVNPTFAFNYQAGRNDVIIGSATTSTSLVASAYVYRYAPQSMLNGPVNVPGTAAFAANYYCNQYNTTQCGVSPQPTLTHDYNLMWEHQIDRNTSIKFGPYYNYANNILVDFRPYQLDTTVNPPLWRPILTQPSSVSNTGIRKGFGFEFGLNHLDNRDTGTSYWIAATYVNFWTNTVSSLTTPYGSVQLPPSTTGVLFRSSQNPPFSGSITADLHEHGLHLIPQIYLQSAVTFYTGTIPSGSTTGSNNGQITAVPNRTPGWGIVNATVLKEIGPNRSWDIGIQATNLLNNNRPITPTCFPSALPAAGLGLGCGALRPIGATNSAPGAIAGQNSYLLINQSSPLILFFLSRRI